MATTRMDNGSDELKSTSCSVCAKKNVSIEAEAYCTECQQYLCVSCTDTHKMFPSMSGHRLLDTYDFSKLSSALPCLPTEHCPAHKGRLLEMYCKIHDEVLCSTCVALNHRSCQYVHSIPDEIDNIHKQSDLEETRKEIHKLQKSMDDIKKSKETRMEESTTYRKDAIDSVKKFRKEMNTILEKLENELVMKVETECDKIERELQKEIIEVRKCKDDLEQSSNKLMKAAGNRAQEFVCVKEFEKNTRKTKEAEPLLQKQDGIVLSVDSVIQEFLEQLNTLGKVSISNRIYAVKEERDVNIKLPNDTDCNIFGSCFIDDGSLLLADFGNITLKRMDASLETVKDYIEMSDSPVRVCQTNSNDVAVALYNGAIQLVSVGEEMVKYKKLRLGHFIFSIEYKDGKLFVTDQFHGFYIYDMAGSLLHKIGLDDDGNKIFSECRHVVLGTIWDKVYVFDKDKGLVTFDPHGNYESTFTDPGLVQTRSACTDERGNMFVCDVNSSNIVQISEQSKRKIGAIEWKHAGEPIAFSFNPKSNTLAVPQSGGDFITVFDLIVKNA